LVLVKIDFVGSVTQYGEESSDMLWLKTAGQGGVLDADSLGPQATSCSLRRGFVTWIERYLDDRATIVVLCDRETVDLGTVVTRIRQEAFRQ